MNRCGLTDTEHMLGDGMKISDEKGAASQMKDQNGDHGEGLLSTNSQGNEVQGNEVHKERDDNTGSCNTQNMLLTTENNCASFMDIIMVSCWSIHSGWQEQRWHLPPG